MSRIETLFDIPEVPRVPDFTNGLQFTVYGTPVPKGSTRAFVPKGWTRPIITAANSKTKPYAQQVTSCALVAMEGRQVITGAVELIADFYFDRPKSKKKSVYKTTKPDLDKLVRLIADSMTGVVFQDDAQCVRMILGKNYGSPARVEIQVREL